MGEHRCLPGVMAKCPYGDRPVCTYEDGSQCEKDNLAYLPPDIMEELKAYRATGFEPQDIKKTFNDNVLLKLASRILGWTPDHLRELARAEKDGRLVVLPCKVGDTVKLYF